MEAKTLGQEALRIRLEVRGPDHSDVLATANVLADIEFARGRPAEAERLHRDILASRRRVLPPTTR